MTTNSKEKALKISYDCADQAIDDLRKQGHDVYWQGYNVAVFVANDRARRNSKGQLRNGRWGYETVYEMDEKGFFILPPIGRSRFSQ